MATVKQFIRVLTSGGYRPTHIVKRPEPAHDRDAHNYLAVRASLTAMRNMSHVIDYECEFDHTNLCRVYRRYRDDKYHGKAFAKSDKGPMCCCNKCAESRGYLRVMTLRQLPVYAEHWNDVTGFWLKDKGCMLPRDLRSGTCLGYACGVRDSHKSTYMRRYRDGLDDLERLLVNLGSIVDKQGILDGSIVVPAESRIK